MLIFEVKGCFKHIKDLGDLYVFSVDELLDNITNDKGSFNVKELSQELQRGEWVVIGDYKVKLIEKGL